MGFLLGLVMLLPLLAETPKPTCNQNSRGRFWPEEANRDRQQLFELSRNGQLEICVGHGRKKAETFQWEVVGVHVNSLPKPRTPEEHEDRQ